MRTLKEQRVAAVQYAIKNDLAYIEGTIVEKITTWHNSGGVQALRDIRELTDALIHSELTP